MHAVCVGQILWDCHVQVIYISTEVGASIASVTKLKLPECFTKVVRVVSTGLELTTAQGDQCCLFWPRADH